MTGNTENTAFSADNAVEDFMGRRIPAVNGYAEPEITTDERTVSYYDVAGDRTFKQATAKRWSKKLGAEVESHTGRVPVYSVGDEEFLSREEAEKRLKSIVKKHRDRVRSVARLFGVDKVSQAVKFEPINWLLKHYSLEDIESFDFRNVFNGRDMRPTGGGTLSEVLSLEAFYNPYIGHIKDPGSSPLVSALRRALPHLDDLRNTDSFRETGDESPIWSWAVGRFIKKNSLTPSDLDGEEAYQWRQDNSRFHDKVNTIWVMSAYHITELLYASARESADYNTDGEVESVLPLELVASLVDADPVFDEMEAIYAEFDRVENGKSLEVGTVRGITQYWLVDDKKNLNPFKQF